MFDDVSHALAAWPQLQGVFIFLVGVASLWMFIWGRKAAPAAPPFPTEGSPVILTGPVNAALEISRVNCETLRSIDRTLSRVEALLIARPSRPPRYQPRSRDNAPPS